MKNARLMILLIDDEEEVLEGLREIIEDRGFACRSFTDPVEALEAFERDLYDIVITDILMPRLDGAGVFRAIRRINPSVCVIFITGYAEYEEALRGLDIRDYFIFHKPLTNLQELIDTLDRIKEARYG